MGVAGLTSYVNQNLRGAVAMEDLREVSSAWGMENRRTCALLCEPWASSCPSHRGVALLLALLQSEVVA